MIIDFHNKCWGYTLFPCMVPKGLSHGMAADSAFNIICSSGFFYYDVGATAVNWNATLFTALKKIIMRFN